MLPSRAEAVTTTGGISCSPPAHRGRNIALVWPSVPLLGMLWDYHLLLGLLVILVAGGASRSVGLAALSSISERHTGIEGHSWLHVGNSSLQRAQSPFSRHDTGHAATPDAPTPWKPLESSTKGVSTLYSSQLYNCWTR